VTNQPQTGAPASSTTLSYTSGPVTASIGGVNALVSFAGLSPGFLGLYQVNLQIPPTSSNGSAVPVTISIGGSTSNQATIAVAAAGS
jgi:uncharacterized protein (TIGR03437 family)